MPDTFPQHIEDFIARFHAARPDHADTPLITDSFGDSPKMADDLLVPILQGIKTATCSSIWEWEHDQEESLTVGTLAIITDGHNQPRCVIETTSVTQTPFNEITADFAFHEGEGDRSYEYWRHEHWTFFSRTLPRIGREPTETMPLLCERFRVIYKEDAPKINPGTSSSSQI